LLAALIAAAIAGGAYLLLHDDGGNAASGSRPSSGRVKLGGLAGFDPFGDNGQEHDDKARLATDGNSTTFWDTEHYNDFVKKGVGLVLQAPRPVALKELTVTTVTGGFDATIQASDSPSSGWRDVSGSLPVNGSTTFTLDTGGKKYGYYMVWLQLPRSGGQAEINEVRART
jgi:hypothetical protein